jgi:dipeptidyl aminopeptidase/acylaminoacyl peptidase
VKPDGFAVLTPAGAEVAAGTIADRDAPGRGWLSPDGKRVAVLTGDGFRKQDGRRPVVEVRDVGGRAFATTVDVDAVSLCWAADGRSLVAALCDEQTSTSFRARHVRIDLASRAVTPLPWPADVLALDLSADGRTVLVFRARADGRGVELATMPAGGGPVARVIALNGPPHFGPARLSPDGKRVLFSDVPPGTPVPDNDMTRRLYVADVGTGRVTEVGGVPAAATVFWCCWSPDGRYLAYARRQRHPELARALSGRPGAVTAAEAAVETESALVVADTDGRNARVVTTARAGDALALPFRGLDWR